jgi:predicted DNA binding CopG/RHH family protein
VAQINPLKILSLKNNKEIHIRLPEKLKIQVEEKAQEMGLTTSAYIKHLIHNAFNN